MMTRALALVMALATPLWAAEVHVAPGAGTLADAIAGADPGDVLMLSGGAYLGPVTIDRTMTLQGDGTATIDGLGQGTVITVSGDDVVLTGLHVTGSGKVNQDIDAGIKIVKGADRARIEGNRLTDNMHGIDVHGGLDTRVLGNVIEGRQNPRMNERGNGIYVWNSPGTVVEGNSVRWGRDGIFSNASKKGTYRGNLFRDLRFAVHYMYTHDSVVSGNVSIGNHLGFAIMFSDRVTVTDNLSLGDREHGMMLNFANGADVARNLVRGGTKKCIFIYNAHKNLIANNRFQGCGIGIHFTAGSERNMLTGNAFIANREQVKYVGTRFMEWSLEDRGNYWSDHPAFDLNGDGIADGVYRPNDLMDHVLWSQPAASLLIGSPAVQLVRWSQSSFPAILPGGVTDSHPLMQPHDIPVPSDIAALEADVKGRWTESQYDDIDLDDLGSH
jgi:nitrous oxidase accessory protein